jgi:hypothetical protein
MNRDYLQDALHSFNLNTPNWYGWRTHDDNGNKIPNENRMCYECIKIIKDGAVMPTKVEVETKIQELKDAEITKAINKQSALNKLKALGLNDAEIKAIIGN